MIDKVSKIAKNPIKAIQEEENEAMMMQQLLEKAKHEGNTELLELQTKKEVGSTPMETQILEDTIMKIGALLALGFGEAGSEIIATNIQKGGDVNPMIGGKKVIAIFGFCFVHHFVDTTEVLQEEIMM